MNRPILRILLIEDTDADAALLGRALSQAYDARIHRVQTEPEMQAALDSMSFDLVLSDYSLPRFSGLAALALLQRSTLDVPFIVVSGTVGEDVAVEAMRAGAQDFFPKDRLQRLIPAIERELREAQLRREAARVQEQLLISDRMAAIGILAAGVAHEINNPLAVLLTNLEVAELDLAQLVEGGAAEGASKLREPIVAAREAAERVVEIAKDLRIFSRPEPEQDEPSAVDVIRVLDSSIRMARTETKHRARVVREYESELPRVRANEGRLGQVFLNLIINAAHALPAGDTESHAITLAARAEGDRVLVEVRDTGGGIAPSHLPRLFEPFFTTKPIGVGTGLGLAICHRIVSGLGGSIEVESRLGEGTTFTVALPVASGSVPTREPAPVLAPSTRSRIMVVDDEIALARGMTRMLAADHEVETFVSGAEALARIVEGARFDVILCDLMMPAMTGMELHAALAREAPDQAQRMVFCTGGAFTPEAVAFLASCGRPTLDKPFDRSTLFAVVAQVREEERGR